MSTVQRHGQELMVEAGAVLRPTFRVDADGAEWFGGWVEIKAQDQSKMRFLVPIGAWSPVFEKPRASFGSVPCGNRREFRHLLEVFTIVAQVKEAIVYEQVPQRDSAGNWLSETKDYELFRITHKSKE
jgi:hypothetical protein